MKRTKKPQPESPKLKVRAATVRVLTGPDLANAQGGGALGTTTGQGPSATCPK